jgi:hypothetical protein
MSTEMPIGPFRCRHCGNKTRFDVTEKLTRRRYHHYTLGGDYAIDEEEVVEREILDVTCRWCERSDGIEPQSPADS